MRRSKLAARPRIRVFSGDDIVIGPGKADLLEAIDRTGSIRSAAEEMQMSYMRAWSLVREMNDGFREPVVTRTRGGATGGGAALTASGREVLELYRAMERRSLKSIDALLKRLQDYT